ncbi:MAG: hypothetical protein A3H32_05800 [Betaproteobacteria bacterium RIFCSPLOWO2_02_FULL_63_19]|nr:MAG: hypothetical protein A3H32_05800 [Betaproteobacteria bacterium RIFCSPLOWO2_02_FULL_63_19]
MDKLNPRGPMNWERLLVRAATLARGALDARALREDVERALKGAEQGWPNAVDALHWAFLLRASRQWRATKEHAGASVFTSVYAGDGVSTDNKLL